MSCSQLPEHLQWVGLMDLNATFRTVIALLKVLHNTALTDCKRNIFKMSFSSRLRQVNPSFKRSFRIKEREAEK